MGIEIEREGPSVYTRISSKHECKTPGGWTWYGGGEIRWCEYGIGTIFKCDECGRKWVSSKVHCLNLSWRATWRRKRWYRPFPWPFRNEG